MNVPLKNGRLFIRLLGIVLFFQASNARLSASSAQETFPSAEDRGWIAQHPVVRVGVDPDWAPFSFRDSQGRLQGVDLELLDLISKHTGLRFEVSTKANWDKVIQAARAGEFDLLASTALSPQRQKEFLFSDPYFNFPVALVTRQKEPFLISLAQLRGRRVASPREHVTTEALASDYPELMLVLTSNTSESLRMVSNGKADATVVQLAHASYLIRDLGLTNLKVSGITDYQFDLRYAIRPDWREFQIFMDKTVMSLPKHEVAEILSRWIHVEREPWITWNTVKPYFLAFALLIAAGGILLICWNTLQRREIAHRRRTEVALKAAHDRLERLNDDKNSIMQMVAHDLRNPLTGIVSGVEFVKFELGEKADPPVLESLNEIMGLSGRIQNLVDQLVTVTTLESGELTLKQEKYDAKMIARRTVESFRTVASGKDIELKASYPPGECMATGDPLALERIVENLVSNAVKFSPFPSVVELELEVREDWLILRVKDQGPGFTDEDKKKLFKKFSHLSARPTAGETSTGLGLSIVKALVTALNGEILYETKPAVGTTFVVTLPRHLKG